MRGLVCREQTGQHQSLRAHAIVHLDGEVSMQVAGVKVFSKREDIAFEIGLGAIYEGGG